MGFGSDVITDLY